MEAQTLQICIHLLCVIHVFVDHSKLSFVYWAYGDVPLHHSNAFSVLPSSAACNVAIVAMIAHQVIAALKRMLWHCFHISASVQGPF